jgi:hypothetical protein
MDRGLQFYTGYTLVDITATGVTRYRPDQEFQRNQQRNWETVLQTIGLRTQPVLIKGPVCTESTLGDGWEFGEYYQGRHKIWIWTFAVETPDVFLQDNNPIGALVQDFEQIPIIQGLEETARFMLPIFYPHGSIKNVYFKNRAIDLNNV